MVGVRYNRESTFQDVAHAPYKVATLLHYSWSLLSSTLVTFQPMKGSRGQYTGNLITNELT